MSVSFALLLALSSVLPQPGTQALSPIGQTIANFKLRDFRGNWHELDNYRDKQAIVVVFLGTECPLVKLYAPRLEALHQELQKSQAMVIGINANRHDSISEITRFADQNKITFPILKDVGNVVADAFGATRTPEAFVLDQTRTIRYQGRIDDQYGVGVTRQKANRLDLEEAVREVLAGKEVRKPFAQPVGCLIGRVRRQEPTGTITYANQVSRILQARCVECHRTGQVAPFALTEYDEVVGWADMIAEVIEEQIMPPWHANPEYGNFSNSCQMTEQEKETIYAWIENGMPKGDPKDLPEPLPYADGWRIPEPDLVISLPEEFTILPEGELDPKTGKPTGQIDYKYFVAEHEFTEDKWVQAAEAKPGNPAVVHHIIVFVKPPGEGKKVHGELSSDWLVATAPGAMPLRLPEGMAKRIPKGSKLVFQLHYTPNGTEQVDRSSVGIVFADPKTVKKEVATDKVLRGDFLIPAGADNHRVEASKTFRRDVLLLALFPHMHLRGKSFRYVAEYPDGRPEEILLDIPRYDFKWQNSYIFAEPKLLPKGTTLRCIAHYDNSKENPANPNPDVDVRWGDQTWEEMMIGYFDMVLADQDLTKPTASRTEAFLKQTASAEPTGELMESASRALVSSDLFAEFAERLQKNVPQLDRFCVTTIAGDEVTVMQAIHSPAVRRNVAMAGFQTKAVGFALHDYAQRDQNVVHAELAASKAPDLRMMSRLFASSFHVPITIDGQPATVNFWSTEPAAFPDLAQKYLGALAKQMK